MARMILSVCLLMLALTLEAQRCGFERFTAADPDFIAFFEQRLALASQGIAVRTPVTIPVVFHVVYFSEEENLSERQLRSQIDVLNRDFAFMSENVFRVPGEFRSLGADSEIRFCLATTDPAGQPASGITRTKTEIRFIGDRQESDGRHAVHYKMYGGKDAWDPDRYLNIWVAGLDGVLGSGTMPGQATFPEEDGLVIDPRYVGAIGSGGMSDPFDRGHTVTHEVGHYLGLLHLWGSSSGDCDEDDLIADTPQQETPYLGCPDYPQISCGSSDMFMNFMDYTDDRCLALFTRDQVARMQAVLMDMRPGLVDHASACMSMDTIRHRVRDALVYYDSGSGQLIIELQGEGFPRRVSVYAMDGRLINDEPWMQGALYWLDTRRYPAGMYVVCVESGGETAAFRTFFSH